MDVYYVVTVAVGLACAVIGWHASGVRVDAAYDDGWDDRGRSMAGWLSETEVIPPSPSSPTSPALSSLSAPPTAKPTPSSSRFTAARVRVIPGMLLPSHVPAPSALSAPVTSSAKFPPTSSPASPLPSIDNTFVRALLHAPLDQIPQLIGV